MQAAFELFVCSLFQNNLSHFQRSKVVCMRMYRAEGCQSAVCCCPSSPPTQADATGLERDALSVSSVYGYLDAVAAGWNEGRGGGPSPKSRWQNGLRLWSTSRPLVSSARGISRRSQHGSRLFLTTRPSPFLPGTRRPGPASTYHPSPLLPPRGLSPMPTVTRPHILHIFSTLRTRSEGNSSPTTLSRPSGRRLWWRS